MRGWPAGTRTRPARLSRLTGSTRAVTLDFQPPDSENGFQALKSHRSMVFCLRRPQQTAARACVSSASRLPSRPRNPGCHPHPTLAASERGPGDSSGGARARARPPGRCGLQGLAPSVAPRGGPDPTAACGGRTGTWSPAGPWGPAGSGDRGAGRARGDGGPGSGGGLGGLGCPRWGAPRLPRPPAKGPGWTCAAAPREQPRPGTGAPRTRQGMGRRWRRKCLFSLHDGCHLPLQALLPLKGTVVAPIHESSNSHLSRKDAFYRRVPTGRGWCLAVMERGRFSSGTRIWACSSGRSGVCICR